MAFPRGAWVRGKIEPRRHDDTTKEAGCPFTAKNSTKRNVKSTTFARRCISSTLPGPHETAVPRCKTTDFCTRSGGPPASARKSRQQNACFQRSNASLVPFCNQTTHAKIMRTFFGHQSAQEF